MCEKKKGANHLTNKCGSHLIDFRLESWKGCNEKDQIWSIKCLGIPKRKLTSWSYNNKGLFLGERGDGYNGFVAERRDFISWSRKTNWSYDNQYRFGKEITTIIDYLMRCLFSSLRRLQIIDKSSLSKLLGLVASIFSDRYFWKRFLPIKR